MKRPVHNLRLLPVELDMRSRQAFMLAVLAMLAGCASPPMESGTKVDDSTSKQLPIYDSQLQDLLTTIHDPALRELLTKMQRSGGCPIPVC